MESSKAYGLVVSGVVWRALRRVGTVARDVIVIAVTEMKCLGLGKFKCRSCHARVGC